MSSTRPNLAVQIAVQWVAWALSAGMTIFLLPFLILFWLWSALTDYSATVKKKDKSSSKRSLVSRGLGTSQFVQLKVKSQFSFFLLIPTYVYKWGIFLFLFYLFMCKCYACLITKELAHYINVYFYSLNKFRNRNSTIKGCEHSLHRRWWPITTTNVMPARFSRILVLLATSTRRVFFYSLVFTILKKT